MAVNLSAGQAVTVRFDNGAKVAGVIKSANSCMACFQPDGEADRVIVLRRNLHAVEPVWAFQGIPVQIQVKPVMTKTEFHRRLMRLERETRYIVEGK